jgi:hypothetical protein
MGPPLAFWLGEFAFRIAGVAGVYLLSQACIVLALWAVFRLGTSIVGVRHAVLAVLMMTGIAAYNVPTPEFGPAMVALPLWALALLHYWRAAGEDRRGYWFLLAVDLGLLLLTDYIGVILIVILIVFTPTIGRGRRALLHMEPWLALILLAIVIFPHAVWLKDSWRLVYAALIEPPPHGAMLTPWMWLGTVLLLSHVGVGLLVLLASGWRLQAQERAPEIARGPVERAAAFYVYVLALSPALVAMALVAWFDRLGPLARIGPLVVLTALAVIVVAGDRIYLYRERVVSLAWVALLTAPPVLVVLGILLLPWTLGYDLRVGQRARAMGDLFAENFQRRVGKPLPFVAGDPQLAALVALTAPGRPRLYLNGTPERSPWADAAALRANGAILLWPATDTAGTPPAAVKAAFPEIVPELPRAFARPIQGLLPLTRIGWAVLRPVPPRQ